MSSTLNGSDHQWMIRAGMQGSCGWQSTADDLAVAVVAAAVAEAERTARVVVETQAAVAAATRAVAGPAAARMVAEAAAAAALAVAAAVEASAAVVAVVAAAAAQARRTTARLTHDVLHDDLTGLANRRLLLDRLTQALGRANRDGTYVAVLFLDIDGFKAVNDRFGHATGDQLLIAMARQLQNNSRETDTCARVGGDEFVIVREDLHDPADGPLMVRRLQTALAAGVTVGERTIPIPVSVGLALGAAGSLPLDLLEEADTAMYRAKARTGRAWIGRCHDG